jgi:hypothetical protein
MEHTVNAHSLSAAVNKIHDTTGFSRTLIRARIWRSEVEQQAREKLISEIRVGKMPLDSGYLTFNGVLPVELPNGTRIVILPDLHAPAHHKAIMWAVKEFLHDYQPHILILIGDACDAFALSAWPKPPRVPVDLNRELWETRQLIDELMEISGCVHCFVLMGNHEDRARRWLTNFGGALSHLINASTHEPILSFHELMGYKPGDNVSFIYDAHQAGGFGGAMRVNDSEKISHGYIVRPRPGASPRAVTDQILTSFSQGHTHRAAHNHRELPTQTLSARELGHLLNPFHPMMAYANLLNNWHPGLGAAEVVNGKVMQNFLPVIQVPIGDGRQKYAFAFNGKLYLAADRG